MLRWISKWVFRLRATFLPGRLEHELSEEMVFHLEMEAERLVQGGLPPEEALRQARRSFGEPEYHKEKTRESWGIGMVQNFRVDARHTFRTLRRNPTFAVVSILTLGLGIGANSAIFSVVNGILLRSLPYHDADRLVSLCETMPDEAGRCVTASTPNVADWAERSSSFEGIGAYRWWGHVMEEGDEAEAVSSLIATPEFFDVMRYRPVLGRILAPEDQLEGNRNVAVLDHDFWQARFGSDPNIVGRTLILSGASYQVIGVLEAGDKPPSTRGERAGDIWLPLHFDPSDNERRNWRGFYAIGRLAPNGTLEVARQELAVIQQGLIEEHPVDNTEWGLQLASLQERVVGHVRPTLLIFLGAVGLVLLITCANIANLILARMSSRETELGIRTAIGADTPRLVGLLLSEGLILAILGGGVGLLLAWLGTPFFISLAPAGIPRLEDVRVDWMVLAFTLGLAVFATLLFGMAPLARASRVEPMWALRGGRHGKPRQRLGGVNGALVISEVALALTLLVGAGLLTRSFVSLFNWDPGFDQDHLLTVRVTATTSEYRGDPDAVIQLYRTIDEQLASLPGVLSVGRASAGPLFGGWEPDQIHPGTQAGETGSGRPVRWYDIGPGYFDALGVPILAGRDFAFDDNMDAPRVALVNQALAERLWPGENPLGQSVWMEMNEIVREVVGVVGNVQPLDPDAPVESEIFWPQAQYTRPVTYLVVRTDGDPAGLERAVVDRIKEIDPKIQVEGVGNYREMLSRRLVQPRFNMLLIGIFSGVAMLLAAVGIFGVVSRSVAARTREIGIRIALGAPRGKVVREVVGGSMALTGAGVMLGLILAWGLSRFIRSMLHGVVPTDPLTYTLVAAALLSVALMASLVPALTASRVDPMDSLREE